MRYCETNSVAKFKRLLEKIKHKVKGKQVNRNTINVGCDIMRNGQNGRFEYWGEVGIAITFALAGTGAWLFNNPSYSDVVAVITLGIAGILGLIVVVFTMYKPFRDLKKRVDLVYDYIERAAYAKEESRILTWDQFSLLVIDLILLVLLEGYSPNLVIGIGRSGGVVAPIVAGCLKHCPILVVDVDIDETTGTHTLRTESEKALEAIPEKSKILIVTADIMRGGSIREIRKKLPGTADVKIACLFQSIYADEKADFSVMSGPVPPEYPFRVAKSFDYRIYKWEGRSTISRKERI